MAGAIADLPVAQGGAIAALPVPETSPVVTPEQADIEAFTTSAGPMRRGLRAAANTVGGTLNQIIGSTGEALGLTQFAQDRYADAKRYMDFAESVDHDVRDYGQVKDFNTLVDFVAGNFGKGVGSSLPALGLSLGLRRPVAGVAIPSMLQEAGGQSIALHNDPKTMATTTPGQRLANEFGVGGINAALEVAGGAPGQMARRILKPTAKGGIGKAFVKGTLGEGGTEGVQNIVGQLGEKQLNPDKQIDPHEVINDTLAGAAGGGTMVAASQAASHAPGAIADTVEALRTKLKRAEKPVDPDGFPEGIDNPKLTKEEVYDWLVKHDDNMSEQYGKMIDPERRAAYTAKLKDFNDKEIKPHIDAAIKQGKEIFDNKIKPVIDGVTDFAKSKTKRSEMENRTQADDDIMDFVADRMPKDFKGGAEPEQIKALGNLVRKIVENPHDFAGTGIPHQLHKVLGPKFKEMTDFAIERIYPNREQRRAAEQQLKIAFVKKSEHDDYRLNRVKQVIRTYGRSDHTVKKDMREAMISELAPRMVDFLNGTGETKAGMDAALTEAFGESKELVLEELDKLRSEKPVTSSKAFEGDNNDEPIDPDTGETTTVESIMAGNPLADARLDKVYSSAEAAEKGAEELRREYGPKQLKFTHKRDGPQPGEEGYSGDKYVVVAEDADQEQLSPAEIKHVKGDKQSGLENGIIIVKGDPKTSEFNRTGVKVNLVRGTHMMMRKEGQQTQEGGAKYVADMFSRFVSSLAMAPGFEGFMAASGVELAKDDQGRWQFPDNTKIAVLGKKTYTYADIKVHKLTRMELKGVTKEDIALEEAFLRETPAGKQYDDELGVFRQAPAAKGMSNADIEKEVRKRVGLPVTDEEFRNEAIKRVVERSQQSAEDTTLAEPHAQGQDVGMVTPEQHLQPSMTAEKQFDETKGRVTEEDTDKPVGEGRAPTMATPKDKNLPAPIKQEAKKLGPINPDNMGLLAKQEAKLAEQIKERESRTVGEGSKKKYNAMAVKVATDLQHKGIPVTHDSPVRHEGKFNWRKYAKTGEGHMAVGAGTYFSTSEGVHKSYKNQFSDDGIGQDDNGQPVRTKESVSPSYHGVIDAHPDEIMDWDKPLSKQSDLVQKALKELGFGELGEIEWKDKPAGKVLGTNAVNGSTGTRTDGTVFKITDIGSSYELTNETDGQDLGHFQSLREAKAFLQGDDSSGALMYRALSKKLGSDAKASDALQAAGIVGHRYAVGTASGRTNENASPNYVVYDDDRIKTLFVEFSTQNIARGEVDPAAQEAVKKYVEKVLGTDKTKVLFEKLGHAGEFAQLGDTEVLKIAVDAIDPMSVGYHEAVHAFFARLMKADKKAAHTLLRAAGAAPIVARLRELLAKHPNALRQLTTEGQRELNPDMTEEEAAQEAAEERLAYMFQFSAAGEKGLLNIGPETKTWFEKVKKFFRSVAAIWSDEMNSAMDFERTNEILSAFHIGAFANRNTVAEVLHDRITPDIRQKSDRVFPALGRFMDKFVFTAQGAVRDMNIQPLIDIMDKFHTDTAGGKAPGYLQAKHVAYNRFMNPINDTLKGLSEARKKEVWDDLHTNKEATLPEAIRIHALLEAAHEYLSKSGVKVPVWNEQTKEYDLVPVKRLEHYFPRVPNYEYLKTDEGKIAFIKLLEKHGVENTTATYEKFSREVSMGDPKDDATMGLTYFTPATNKRTLGKIPDAEMAPFLETDLYGSLAQYFSRATRRAEYAKRFGNQGEEIAKAITAAKAQGLTPAQEKTVSEVVAAMEGTLGSNMSRELKAIYGALTTYQNIRLLPLALFSNLVDPMGIVIRGGTVKEGFQAFWRGMKDLAKLTEDDAYMLSKTVGSINSASEANVVGDMYSSQFMPTFQKKLNDKFFKYIGMESWNRSMRVAGTAAAEQFIIRHATKPNKHSNRYLEELNITKDDVQVDGDKLVLNDKVIAAINLWTDSAIIRPNAANRPIYMSDPNWILISHLKQYSYMFQKVILARVHHEIKNGNYTPAYALASYVPIIIASDMIRVALTPTGSDDHDDWTAMDWLWRGIQRAGFFGPGQQVLDSGTDYSYGKNLPTTILGPSVQQLTDFLSASLGKGGNVGRELGKAIPFGRQLGIGGQ